MFPAANSDLISPPYISILTVPPWPSLTFFSKPSGISTAARISFSTTLSLQSPVVRITLILGLCCSAASTPGESVPPTIITFGFSFLALPITADITAVNPVPITGITSSGTRNVVISVRLSRNASVNSLRYTMPILRRLISDRLLRAIVRRNNFHENLLQIVFSVPLPQLFQRSLGQQFTALDDSHDVAEFFHFAHYVRRKDHRLLAVAA